MLRAAVAAITLAVTLVACAQTSRILAADYGAASDASAPNALRELAQALDRRAAAHEAAGEYRQALPLYRRSLALREAFYGAEHVEVAVALTNLAGILRLIGEYAAALPFSQRSLAIQERARGRDHSEVATSLNNLAVLYEAMGEYGKALPLYERGLAIDERNSGPDDPDVAATLNNLAVLRQAMSEYGTALRLFQRGLAILQKKGSPDDPALAAVSSNLAFLYELMGEPAAALPLYERSLAIREKVSGRDHPETAAVLSNLAGFYESSGDSERARQLYERAAAIYEKAHGRNHPLLATVLANLTRLLRSTGDLKSALTFGQRSLAIREKALGPNHPLVANSLTILAEVHQASGDYTKALRLLERALEIASENDLQERRWRVLNLYRSVLARQGRPDLAIFFGKQAVNTIQALRARLTDLDTQLQRSFLHDKEAVYRELADLLIERGRLPEAQQVLGMLKEEELFDFVRRDGAQDGRRTNADYAGGEEAWRARYEEISGHLGKIGVKLRELTRRGDGDLSPEEQAERERLRADAGVARRAFERFVADLLRDSSAAGAGRSREIGERNLTRLRALQTTLALLGDGVVALHYVIAERKLHVILTAPSIQIARATDIPTAELNRKIHDFHAALSNPGSDPLPLARELYRILIGPVREDLAQAGARTLMVSLDGALRYIPLAALHDGSRYLVEDYRLALFTEAAKDKLKDKPQREWRVAGLGLTRAVRTSGRDFVALPAVKLEFEGILGGGGRGVLPGEVHLDDSFTETRLHDALDKAYPVLHIASHFVFRPGNEADSFLVLGDGKSLTLADLRRPEFDFGHVDLLTLSACETAVGGGRDGNGREIEGFAAIAQDQGAKSVIATLWPVADESTGLLMQNLYRLRQQGGGTTKAEALRQAQLALMRRTGLASKVERGLAQSQARAVAPSGYSHPYYWAPFILMGNWL